MIFSMYKVINVSAIFRRMLGRLGLESAISATHMTCMESTSVLYPYDVYGVCVSAVPI